MFWRRKTKVTPPAVRDGLRVYAMGDIHGRLDLLERNLAAVEADLQSHPVAEHLLVFLGDYVDRGPSSAGVIERLITLRSSHPTVCLKGNHEALMLEALAEPSSVEAWAAVGGLNTAMSYGFTPPSASSVQVGAELSAGLAERLPAAHKTFLTTLSLSFELDDYFFVHAGVRPKVPLDAQREEDLLWIRDEFLLYEAPFERFIVHGHTPMREPDVRPNRMNLDTGAFATSRLTCVALDGTDRRFIG